MIQYKERAEINNTENKVQCNSKQRQTLIL